MIQDYDEVRIYNWLRYGHLSVLCKRPTLKTDNVMALCQLFFMVDTRKIISHGYHSLDQMQTSDSNVTYMKGCVCGIYAWNIAVDRDSCLLTSAKCWISIYYILLYDETCVWYAIAGGIIYYLHEYIAQISYFTPYFHGSNSALLLLLLNFLVHRCRLDAFCGAMLHTLLSHSSDWGCCVY